MEGQTVENLDIEADVHNAHLHESAYLSDDEDKGSGDEGRNYEGHPDAADLPSGGRKKRRCRRNRKAGEHHPSSGRRPYKPYVKLSWEERKQVDEREAKRANLRREQQIAAGQAMAPYNTTQFLMEQHEPLGPSGDVQSFLNVLDKDSSGAGRSSGSVTGESSAADLDDGTEELFLQKEFTEAYENFHAERLQMLTKDELIREYVQMEATLESLKRNHSEPSDIGQNKSTAVAEVQQIKEENARLAKENELLRMELAALKTGPVRPASAPLDSFR